MSCAQEWIPTGKKDALQNAVFRGRSKWWHEPSLIVSILALVMAGIATWLTQVAAAEEAEDEMRQQLASNVQRINSLERESVDLAQRSPELAGMLGGTFTADYALLAAQSADLIAEIPDRANPTEYLVVCRALYSTGGVVRARQLCEEALRRTNNINEAVAGMRSMGFMTAMAGDESTSRQWLQRALTIHADTAKYGVVMNEPQRGLMDFDTHIFWASLEASRNNCKARIEHLSAAETNLLALPNSNAYVTQHALLNSIKNAAFAACPASPA